MSEYVSCPQCGCSDIEKVSWTIWGGAIGPRLLNHAKCKSCGKTYNGKTGESNTLRIVLYNVALLAIAALIVAMLF
jgi:transposase-like protein